MIANPPQIPPQVLKDPLRFQKLIWPHIRFYDKQVEIIQSVVENDETYVPAGNALGKDFVTAFIALWFFLSRSPARVITSSVDHGQLKSVLWGEIRRLLDTARFELPLEVNDLMLRQRRPDGTLEPLSYLIGRVAAKGEGLLGHHLATHDKVGCPRTLVIFDEASGVDSTYYESSDTWAHRKLTIGNPYPCVNFFKTGVKAGDLLAPGGDRYYRKVIRIQAIDSPNVRLAQTEISLGQQPSRRIVTPGVVDWDTYQKRLVTWDKVRQCIGLNGEFYEGAEVLLLPPLWLDGAQNRASLLPMGRAPKYMGIDPAEGGDSSSWALGDDLGLIELVSKKTPNTVDIPNLTIALIKRYGIDPTNVAIDRGGGGKQHADSLREKGYAIRTVGFGEPATDPAMLRRMKTTKERVEDRETRYTYKNRRAEMYGMLREAIDPTLNDGVVYGLPRALMELLVGERQTVTLRGQLAPIPLLWDGEGRLYLPPKSKPPNSNSQTPCLIDMVGCSPDEADALVLMNYVRFLRPARTKAGVV